MAPRRAALLLLPLCISCAGNVPPPHPADPGHIPQLEARVEESPSDSDARVQLGAAYREAGRLEEARRLLEQAVEGDPADGSASLFLGLTYEDLALYGRARSVYGRFLEVGESESLKERVEKRMALLRRRELKAAVHRALEGEAELAGGPLPEHTVAVFPFLYRSGDTTYAPLARSLAAFLVTDLSQTDRLTVIERLRTQLLLDEIDLGESGLVDPATAARSGHLLGAGNVVQGVLEGTPEELLAEIAVVDAADPPPDLRPTVSVRNALREIFDMEKRLALGIFRSLGIELTAAELERVNQRPTQSLEAFLEFGRGLVAEDAGNLSQAARHYARAAELDPEFDMARERAELASGLAEAADVTTEAFARVAEAELLATPEPPAIFDARRAVEEAALLVPARVRRDAVVEALGFEGLASGVTGIRIIIRRPGSEP